VDRLGHRSGPDDTDALPPQLSGPPRRLAGGGRRRDLAGRLRCSGTQAATLPATGRVVDITGAVVLEVARVQVSAEALLAAGRHPRSAGPGRVTPRRLSSCSSNHRSARTSRRVREGLTTSQRSSLVRWSPGQAIRSWTAGTNRSSRLATAPAGATARPDPGAGLLRQGRRPPSPAPHSEVPLLGG
jgi:hypothetical protein